MTNRTHHARPKAKFWLLGWVGMIFVLMVPASAHGSHSSLLFPAPQDGGFFRSGVRSTH